MDYYVITYTSAQLNSVFVKVVNEVMFSRYHIAHATIFETKDEPQKLIDDLINLTSGVGVDGKFDIVSIPRTEYFKDRLMNGEEPNE